MFLAVSDILLVAGGLPPVIQFYGVGILVRTEGTRLIGCVT